jgi:CrcB protein
MTPLVFLGICAAGGVGAALRFVVDGLVRGRWRAAFPYGTVAINLSGSLVLGFLTGLVLSTVLTSSWELVLGTGIMGGYTTFSTASVETVRLAQEGRGSLAAVNAFGVIVGGVLLGFAGLLLGSVL